MTTALNNYWTAAARTAAPIAAGFLLGQPLTRPILDLLGVGDTATLTAAISSLLAAAWYLAAHALEQRWPRLGLLLIKPAAVSYSPAAVAPVDPTVIPDTPDPLADTPDPNTAGSSTPAAADAPSPAPATS